MNGLIKASLLGILVAGLCSMPAAGGETIGCDVIDWSQQILVSFDGIEDACQEVIVRDGNRYFHFEVEFVRASEGGDVQVLMHLQDGSSVERSFPAPKGFEASSSTGRTKFAMLELDAGDILDVYIPLARVVASHDGS